MQADGLWDRIRDLFTSHGTGDGSTLLVFGGLALLLALLLLVRLSALFRVRKK
jgi:hypothetical protein